MLEVVESLTLTLRAIFVFFPFAIHISSMRNSECLKIATSCLVEGIFSEYLGHFRVSRSSGQYQGHDSEKAATHGCVLCSDTV